MDGRRAQAQDADMEQVTPLPPRGAVFGDARDGGRGMRVSWHHEIGCVVLSTWQDDRCVSTALIPTTDVPRLVQVLVAGLAAQVPVQAEHSETA
jgi:hypothetical protein